MSGQASNPAPAGPAVAERTEASASRPAQAPVAVNSVNPLPPWVMAGQPDVALPLGVNSVPSMLQDTLDLATVSAQASRRSTFLYPHSRKGSTAALIHGPAGASDANVLGSHDKKMQEGTTQHPKEIRSFPSSDRSVDQTTRPSHRQPHIPRHPHVHHHPEEEEDNDDGFEDVPDSDARTPKHHHHRVVDEWDQLAGTLSPGERQRLQKEVRNIVANSGSYWQKRKQRRRMRTQMRMGPRHDDPNASFQALDLGIQAAQTFSNRTFTGKTSTSNPHFNPSTGRVQNPDSVQFPFSFDFHHKHRSTNEGRKAGHQHGSTTAGSKSDEHANSHSNTPDMSHIVALATSAGLTPDAEKSSERLQKMSGLRNASFGPNVRQPSELRRGESDDEFIFTRRKARDPNWNTPWTTQLDAGLAHPEVTWGIVPRSRGPFGLFVYRRWRKRRRIDPEKEQQPHDLHVPDREGFGIGFGAQSTTLSMNLLSWTWWHHTLLKNPFVPLTLRVLSIGMMSAALAVGVHIRRSLQHQKAPVSSMGVSPLLSIIYAPITLVHVLTSLYIEYFGRPLGQWSVKSKLIGTSVEVIFVGLWASELSLTFDNYYDLKEHRNAPIFNSDGTFSMRFYHNRSYLMSLQRGLICVVFVAVFVNMSALILTLFKMFHRASSTLKERS